jgi:L-alanine-DL-glutamate epimerase-like enolase superfamily enzyme
MTKRRTFLKSAATGLAAISSPSVFAGSFTQNISDANKNSVNDVLRYISIKDMEFIKLKFDKKTPLNWNAVVKSGGTYPGASFLKITTNEGITGYSLTKGSTDDIKKFAGKLKGKNLLNIEEMWDTMFFHNRKPVAKGKEIHAIGTVDLCIWDIIGKALQFPVHKIMGTCREKIPVYAAGGYYAEGKGIPELVREMEEYVKEGYNVVKMKVGYLDAKEDARRTEAVVKALGKDARVMVDANNGYKRAYEAIRYGKLVEHLDLFWFEEPVAPDDWRGNAECRKELDVPIVAGENEFTRWGARDLVENHSCDIVNIDTVKGGGLTEMKKIAALCSAFHIPVAPHGNAHMNIHAVASISNAIILETYPAKARDFNPALPAFPVKNGMVDAPNEIGLGMEPDPALVKKYRVG